jgi:H+/Cl- antiporter ClcA
MGVGVVASLVGYVYSKCMKAGFKFLWKILPSKVLDNLSLFKQYPAAYIPTIITLGGTLVAILSTFFFPYLFTAHDYVHILSTNDNADMKKFPSARKHLLPVMILCCITSISGFSLGPEAPMVTAGGLVGVSLARKYCKLMNIQSSTKLSSNVEQTLAYSGAAGTLTGFMNIPLAGPIFALEMTTRKAGISPFAAKSWSSAIAASLASMIVIRGYVTSTMNMGGHFLYGPRGTAVTGTLIGKETIVASALCGIGGAVVGTLFHKSIALLKSILWQTKNEKKLTTPSTATRITRMNEKLITITKKVLVALSVGLLSMYFPQTMFWGEGSLQCMIDGQYTPFSITPHGLPLAMTALAIVNPNLPLTSGYAALQIGLAKFLAIALASAGKFPGGVIFPLLSCGAMLSHAFVAVVCPLLFHFSIITTATSSLVVPMMTMSFMAATLTSITRTPLSTVLILALTASSMTSLSVLLPGVFFASYLSVWVSEILSRDSFFSYSSE